ncbi:unnamed protein product [Miscanthus lutarioriparius]|uniref:Uncharacterized protein n=1 Tax=Miscanthus lutarioriparius TaxID=422564 RepID=A0A811PCY3_9POAL|nr:unnamed protein product [Miscanthus lutarioriparius]
MPLAAPVSSPLPPAIELNAGVDASIDDTINVFDKMGTRSHCEDGLAGYNCLLMEYEMLVAFLLCVYLVEEGSCIKIIVM